MQISAARKIRGSFASDSGEILPIIVACVLR